MTLTLLSYTIVKTFPFICFCAWKLLTNSILFFDDIIEFCIQSLHLLGNPVGNSCEQAFVVGFKGISPAVTEGRGERPSISSVSGTHSLAHLQSLFLLVVRLDQVADVDGFTDQDAHLNNIIRF